MEITIKHYGPSRAKPSTIIELTIKTDGASLTVDVTDTKGRVSQDLIDTFRQVANELEEQNNKLNLLKL